MRPWPIAVTWSLAAHAALVLFVAGRMDGDEHVRLRQVSIARIEHAKVEPPPPRVEEEKKPEPKPRIAKKVVKALPKAAPKDPPKPAEEPPKEEPKPSVGMSEDQVSRSGEMAVATGVTLEGEIGTGRGTEKKDAVQDGVPGGRGKGSRPVPIYAVTRLPRPVRLIEPKVPESFRETAREVVVVVEVEIDAKGRVVEARIVRRAGFGLDEAVLSAARSTEFEPALVGAEPVAVRYQIPYRIRVRG